MLEWIRAGRIAAVFGNVEVAANSAATEAHRPNPHRR
jgi:hypothetical protein